MNSDEESLISELKNNGFAVSSVSDLFGKKLSYRSAIPILVKWLPIIDDLQVKEEIVRALSVKWAKPSAGPILIREFESVQDPSNIGIRWAIANALSVVADDSVVDDIIRLVGNTEYGKSREMLVVALGNMKDSKVDELLVELLDVEDLAGHALISVAKRRTSRAKEKVSALMNHPKSWVRKEAKKAMAKLS